MKHALYAALAVCFFAASNGCACCKKSCCADGCTSQCGGCDSCHAGCNECGHGGCDKCGHGDHWAGYCESGRSGLLMSKHQGHGHGPNGIPYDNYQPTPPPSAAGVAYPYYTTRGPRDFLSPMPRSIGP